MTWSVGFDLDMTLADTRPGIVVALDALSAETGVPIDSAAYVAQLGPPVTETIDRLFGPADAGPALATFRRHMAEVGVYLCAPLPGAAEALALIRRLGGKSLVVTAKHEPLAEMTLATCKLAPDIVEGDLWAEEKGSALIRHHAVGYVGDHPGDVRAARVADVWCIGVATGGCTIDELLEAGATEAFPSLLEALPWIEDTLGE